MASSLPSSPCKGQPTPVRARLLVCVLCTGGRCPCVLVGCGAYVSCGCGPYLGGLLLFLGSAASPEALASCALMRAAAAVARWSAVLSPDSTWPMRSKSSATSFLVLLRAQGSTRCCRASWESPRGRAVSWTALLAVLLCLRNKLTWSLARHLCVPASKAMAQQRGA